MTTDADAARASARSALGIYADLPNYRNNWHRLGFTDADIDDGGTDDFIDTLVAWGDVDTIRERLRAHWDAGADHVCIQPLHPSGEMGSVHWDALEALAPARA